MLENKEDRWFGGLEDDSSKVGCGACIPELTTRRHRGKFVDLRQSNQSNHTSTEA